MFRSALRALSVMLLAPALAFGGDDVDANALEKTMRQQMQAKQYAAVIETGKKLLEVSPDHADAIFNVGYALHSEGKIDEALEYHKRAAGMKGQNQGTSTYNVACALAMKGETDAAFEWLGKATAFRGIPVDQYKNDPDLASLRSDPRFEKVLAAVTAANTVAKNGQAGQPAFMVYNQTTPRSMTRVAVFDNNGCRGQVAIEYGTVTWKDALGEQLEKGALDGQRWRLGSDFWTNIDASTSFKLGDQSFSAGTYFLVAERTKEGKYLLTVLDAKEIHKARIDAFESMKSTGGTAVELSHEKSETSVENLTIKLATAGQTSTKGSLVISFGPHKLSAPFAIDIEE